MQDFDRNLRYFDQNVRDLDQNDGDVLQNVRNFNKILDIFLNFFPDSEISKILDIVTKMLKILTKNVGGVLQKK